ncbi:MAG: alanine/ornithine racemase family PLP-dependent enzyme [Firmicutes bacterium]|nr:alanine/ornithine racemase family PLP-dependent enzyme [Bacillota bacterium]HOB34550.1 alanine/ornithine racemase family PLP-dependent enzyme [Bacillota bacterium]HPZ91067.1 alanine/ornithine racemase family PLP-dependent enzyme [Bacillota bacterium]HQE01898.1 alanine/ornithine racemase family PLP-dependent enzyme [Bacillota bacterium]
MQPKLSIDLDKIRANAALLAQLCRQRGVVVAGVTKAACGDPLVARAMLAGGLELLAESRLENARRLRAAGITAPLMLLRLPMPGQAREVVELFQCSLNSELAAIKALNEAAGAAGLCHDIILMVDLGDLREGIWPDALDEYVREIARLEHIRLLGLGTNLTCYGGVIPSPENLGRLVQYHRRAEAIYGRPLPVISGGNSSSLPLVLAGTLPPITQLRLGESILLGRETTARQPIPGAHLDCFRLEAEIIELKEKPSLPVGEIGQDAFGGAPVFVDKGIRRRAILALGRQDVVPESLTPPPGAEILGASSDHLIVDVTDYPEPLAVGDVLAFNLGYGALLAAMTSPYVGKEYCGER